VRGLVFLRALSSNGLMLSNCSRLVSLGDVVHDHNFNFLTANYFGPGYETEVWRLNRPKSEGYWEGEPVDLVYQGIFKLEPFTLLYYERGVDVHLQLPPEDYSVSLNLMISTHQMRGGPQHIFNTNKSIVSGFPEGTISSRRVQFLQLVGWIGDQETADRLDQIRKNSHCQRTRAAAQMALENIS
jgi:hypothetical protein